MFEDILENKNELDEEDKYFKLDNFSFEQSNTALFNGQVKIMYLVTEPCYFFDHSCSPKEVRQKLVISEDGCVNIIRKISIVDSLFNDICVSNGENNIITEQLKLSKGKTVMLFNCIGNYFSQKIEPLMCCDIGSWDLVLTNTEGESFSFSGFNNTNDGTELYKLSNLIRDVTGLQYLYGFDEQLQN